MSRWHLACDHCVAGARVGPTSAGLDAWCEACQSAHTLPPGAPAAACPGCGVRLSVHGGRFEELLGESRNVAAVPAAWGGEPAALEEILPERTRFPTDLTPPEPAADDPPALRAALEALHAGHFAPSGASNLAWPDSHFPEP